MTTEVPKALGALPTFATAWASIKSHLIQCDTAVGSDEVLAPRRSASGRVTGYGGSDSPAMLAPGRGPDVSAAIVVTDATSSTQRAGAYNVLWVLRLEKPGEFTPRYGKVIAMTQLDRLLVSYCPSRDYVQPRRQGAVLIPAP